MTVELNIGDGVAQAIMDNMTAEMVVAILADRKCEHNTVGICPPGRHPLAKYGADAMCDPCLARLVKR